PAPASHVAAVRIINHNHLWQPSNCAGSARVAAVVGDGKSYKIDPRNGEGVSGAHRTGGLINSSCLAGAIKRPLRRMRVTCVVRESAAKADGGSNRVHRAGRWRG